MSWFLGFLFYNDKSRGSNTYICSTQKKKQFGILQDLQALDEDSVIS